MDDMEPQAYAFHQPFAWSTARLLQARTEPVARVTAVPTLMP